MKIFQGRKHWKYDDETICLAFPMLISNQNNAESWRNGKDALQSFYVAQGEHGG